LPLLKFKNPMATYKKRGVKPAEKRSQQPQSKSTTAEVFDTLDDTASKSEQWIEKNNKPLFYGLVAIAVIILGFLAYNKYVIEPTETRASNELAYPRAYFNQAATATGSDVDSLLNLGINGAEGKYGFIDVANEFSGTKAANIANYYAGVSYLQLKDYEKAIDYLSKFDSDDELLGPAALGATGDAFADINQPEDALDYYVKAANKRENEYTTPLFLFKAAQIAMELKKYSNAEDYFTRIKDEYPGSAQGRDIEKYINSAKFAQ